MDWPTVGLIAGPAAGVVLALLIIAAVRVVGRLRGNMVTRSRHNREDQS